MKKLYTFKNGPVFWPTLYIMDWLVVNQSAPRHAAQRVGVGVSHLKKIPTPGPIRLI